MDTRILRALRKNQKGQSPKRSLAPNQCPPGTPALKGREDQIKLWNILKSHSKRQTIDRGLVEKPSSIFPFEKVFTACFSFFEIGDWSIDFEFYCWNPKPWLPRNLGDFWTLSCKSSLSEFMCVTSNRDPCSHSICPRAEKRVGSWQMFLKMNSTE